MKVLLLDTNVASILFNPDHTLYQTCFDIVDEHQCHISFMTRSEMLLWPKLNRWGSTRRSALEKHISLYTTLHPDEETCAVWANTMAESRVLGRPVTVADAWIAATARRWNLPLVTTDYRDFQHLAALTLIPV